MEGIGWIRSVLYQHRNRRRMARKSGERYGRHPIIWINKVDIRAMFEQKLGDIRAAMSCRDYERCTIIGVLCGDDIDVSTTLNQ